MQLLYTLHIGTHTQRVVVLQVGTFDHPSVPSVTSIALLRRAADAVDGSGRTGKNGDGGKVVSTAFHRTVASSLVSFGIVFLPIASLIFGNIASGKPAKSGLVEMFEVSGKNRVNAEVFFFVD